jgi:hypothetical protein
MPKHTDPSPKTPVSADILSAQIDTRGPAAQSAATRRAFLRRALYAAPVLSVLGTLATPPKAHADFGGPPSSPEGL